MTQGASSEPLAYAAARGPISVLGVVSMSLGIVATPLNIVFLAGMPVALIALVLAILSLVRIKRRGQRGRAFAIAGIILSCIALLVGTACGVLFFPIE